MSVPSVPTKIRQALKARINTLPMKAAYPIVWSDEGSYTPNPNAPYMRCTWSANATQREWIGSTEPHRYPGVLIIDTMGTVAQGTNVALEVAGQVALHFPADLMMDFQGVRVRVIKSEAPRLIDIATHVHYALEIQVEVWA